MPTQPNTTAEWPLSALIARVKHFIADLLCRLLSPLRLRQTKQLTASILYVDHSTIESFVCERCWKTVFSAEAFAAMRQNPPEDDLWYKGSGFKYETPPWDKFQDAAKFCPFCCLVFGAIAEYSETPPSAEETFLVTLGLRSVEAYSAPPFEIMAFVVNDGSIVPDSQDYTVCTTDGALQVKTSYGICINDDLDDAANPHIHARVLPMPTNSMKTYGHVLECIEKCASHDLCPRPTPALLPTRVMDCIDPERPRLITSDLSTKASYTALSYVWGESQPHRTTAENIKDYHTFIDPRHIPQTIRDAIAITNRLGLRYLWVDSFCIMQDSEEDKGHEIERIRIYFQHAFITIVAANANRVSEGFLHDHPKWHLTPINLPFRSPDGFLGKMSLYRTYADWPTRDDPVDQRAWCLEERVLSPRRLLFCSHALQYECQTMRINVNGSPLGLPDMYPRLPDCAFTDNSGANYSEAEKGELVNDWDNVVNHYTRRKLTKSKDKLVAIAGVADKFHQFWPQSQYVAGLWSHQLPEALLWHVDDSSTLGWQDVRNPLPRVYRAPSWSWASVDGAIQTLRFVPQAEDSTAFCVVKNCEATLKRDTNPYGEITSGLLSFEVNTMVVTWTVSAPQLRSNNIFISEMHESEKQPVPIGYLSPDSSELLGQEKLRVVLAGLQKAKTTVFGLALVPLCLEGDILYHRRIGWARVDIEHWTPEPSRPLHVI